MLYYIIHAQVKENFCGRFASRMKQILALFDAVSASNRLLLAKTVQQWRKRSTFPPSVLPLFEDLREALEGPPPGAVKAAADALAGAPKPPASASASHSSSSAGGGGTGGAAKAKEAAAAASKASSRGAGGKLRGGKRGAIRFCAFREGSCPFGDKCRYSHIEQGAHGEYMLSRGASTKQPTAKAADSRTGLRFSKVEARDLPSSEDAASVGLTVSQHAFPVARAELEAEQVPFKRHRLEHGFAVQDSVAFSWISEQSMQSLL